VIMIKTLASLTPQYGTSGGGMQYIFPKGYHVRPEFPMPDYTQDKVRDLAFEDNRSTICWIPELTLDAAGKGQFSFYSADGRTTYTVYVKGISTRGDWFERTFTISRK